MLKQLQKTKDQKGFTIIEVLIVLAIAGLILLIVFLAVPALQRNSRNTQRKNDVAAVLASFSEYMNNNNGVAPDTTAWTNSAGKLTITGVSTGVSSEAKVGFYNQGVAASNGGVFHAANNTATAAGTLDSNTEDYVIIASGTECNNSASQAGPTRSVTAVYEIEKGAGTYAQVCQSM